MKKLLLLLGLLIPGISFAQSYSIDWYKIAGGGGPLTGPMIGTNNYSITGTIGQPDASGAMTGPAAGTNYYSITGGFWSLINVVQMPGVPKLLIVANGPGSVKVLWPNTGRYTLQQNADVGAPGGWTTSGYSISTSNGTNSITITPPTGNLYFRLSNP